MLNFELFLIILISYLFGSIPFGLLLTKIFLKKDIREIGSGNIGATNVLRSGNKILGYSTLVLDILKAVLPILYVKFFMNDYLYISALSIFIGHVFPIWLKFKGGKGVASYLGILCCLDIFTALIFGIVWISIFILLRKRYRTFKIFVCEEKYKYVAHNRINFRHCCIFYSVYKSAYELDSWIDNDISYFWCRLDCNFPRKFLFHV